MNSLFSPPGDPAPDVGEDFIGAPNRKYRANPVGFGETLVDHTGKPPAPSPWQTVHSIGLGRQMWRS